MSYKTLGYSLVRRIVANLDKCSRFSDSKVVRSPWGIFRMYKSNSRGRFYSVSGSAVIHNGGSYKIGSLRARLMRFA